MTRDAVFRCQAGHGTLLRERRVAAATVARVVVRGTASKSESIDDDAVVVRIDDVFTDPPVLVAKATLLPKQIDELVCDLVDHRGFDALLEPVDVGGTPTVAEAARVGSRRELVFDRPPDVDHDLAIAVVATGLSARLGVGEPGAAGSHSGVAALPIVVGSKTRKRSVECLGRVAAEVSAADGTERGEDFFLAS
ncbi:MAG: hypothetical protein KC586_27690, partial [Myxococcales bacterium]|nr:hypothetical protein [Myxococcales bacterium]